MYILYNRTIIQRSLVFNRIMFLVESKKDQDSKTYYHTVTVEYPDEHGKFIFYLMPSYRLPYWSKVLRTYYQRRYPLSSQMADTYEPLIKDFVKQNKLR